MSGHGQSPAFGRRSFLKGTVGSVVLAVGVTSAGIVLAQEHGAADADLVGPTVFRTWVVVGPDNVTTLYSPEVEYGQGTLTALAMLVADEMDCDFSTMTVRQSPTEAIYRNPISQMVATNSSAGLRFRFDQMRQIGAIAREMYKQAAASEWGVPTAELSTADSVVSHSASGRTATYAALSTAAAVQPMPSDIALRDPSQWRYIGKPTPRLDIVEKSTGQTRYAVDLRLPGLLFAEVKRAPIRGAKVVSYDARAALARKGVLAVENLEFGIAVVADEPWVARRALQDVEIVWEDSPWAQSSSASLDAEYRAALDTTGTVAKEAGSVSAAEADPANNVIEVEYASQFLHHMCMEPMSATAWVRDGICEIWSPTNGGTNLIHGAAFFLNLPPEKVIVHRSEFIGGSFGRRDRLDQDIEAVILSQKLGAPVQVVQRRENDTQMGFYRPMQRARVKAAINADGQIVSWNQKIAVQSMAHDNHDLSELKYVGFDTSTLESYLKDGGSPFYNLPYDFFTASQTPGSSAYEIPNLHVEMVKTQSPLPITYWRSVGQSNNTWECESIVDELAFAAGVDPLLVRQKMLGKQPRAVAVLDRLAEIIGWSGLPEIGTGKGWGLGLCTGFGSYTAMAMQVEVVDKKVTVHRVVAVADQGITINPEQSEAQIQGGVVDGLGATLIQQITLTNGMVDQSNWHNYPTLKMRDMPQVEVYFIESGALPIGSISESATPVAQPAFLNAFYVATGLRIRDLPLARHGYEI